MSTVSTVSPISLAPPPVARRGRFALLRRNVWALGDQGLISASNFVTGVLTARALDRDEFGAFSIIYSVLLLANIVQSGLITQAHNVIGATRSGEDYRRYTTSTGAGQLLLLLLELLIALPLAGIALARGWSIAPMLLALAPAILFWQLQEFIRRVLYTESRYAGAFWNDMISYGGQAALLGALYAAWAVHDAPFTGALALYVLAGTSALAVLLGAWQIRHSLARHLHMSDLRENWRFGKWLVGGELLQWCTSLQMQLWWAWWLLGAWASADLRAAQILFGPARVFTFFLGTVLPIKFARTLHARGGAGLHTELRRVLVWLVPIGGAYCALLAIYPRPLLHLVYGAHYAAADAAAVLTLYAIASFISYIQMVVVAALTASRKTRAMFAGSVCGAVAALAASPVFIRLMGAPGAIVSMILTMLVVTFLFIAAYRRGIQGNSEAGVDSFEGPSRAPGAPGEEVV